MKNKPEIITFKVDEKLSTAMRGVENRSEFIRKAILASLNCVCPLCKGTGILTTDQSRHWDEFAQDHTVEECDNCHAMRLVCVKIEKSEQKHEE